MAQDMNSVSIIGNLTRDPELRHTPSGTAVCNLGVAVNDRVKRGGEWQDTAYFFDVTVWAGQGESCAQYLSKGKKVGITGKLTWRSWEDKETGAKRSKVEIVANSVQFLTPRSDDGDYGGSSSDYSPPEGAVEGGGEGYGLPGGDQQQEQTEPAASTAASTADDDIPF